MGEVTNRTLPRVLLSLIAALLLAFVIGYIGVSGFGGEPIGVEKASAYPGEYVEDIAATAKQDASEYWYKWFADNGSADSWVDPDLYWVYNHPVSVPCGESGVHYPEEGPMYCSADMGIYYTVNWGGNDYGDGAIAAVMAHEVGHHVQNLAGILAMKAGGQLYTVHTELQADCFAGVYMADAYWNGMLDGNDIDQARDWMYHAGDEKPVDDADHHGSGQQRLDWFNYGWDTEDPTECAAALG
jgi:predicted metalloprotease